MSWKVIKELKEKRAKAFADAQSIRDGANKDSRDLSTDEETRHVALLGEVDSYGKRIEREERSASLGEVISERGQIGREDSEQRGNTIGMPAKDFSKYSLLRAINKRVNNEAIDGLEAEVSQELALRTNRKAQGFYMPTDLPMVQNRTILDTTQGAGAIPTILGTNFIDALRNKVVCAQMGASFLPNMIGSFALPKQTGVGTAYWVAEGSAPTASFQTIGQVGFVAKTLGGYTDLSRKFVNQSAIDAESFVRNDLARILAIELDRAALFGTGSSNQPLGIVPNLVANLSANIIAMGTNGAVLDYPSVVSLETTVASENADAGQLSYLTNAKVRGALKTTVKSATAATVGFVWDDNEVNSYPAYVSNNVPSNGTKGSGTALSTMIFGDFTSLYFALWGGLDILVDPYTGGNAGTVRINALQDVDINVRYLQSFAAIKDIIA